MKTIKEYISENEAPKAKDLYSCVLLDEESKNLIRKMLGVFISVPGWKEVLHHMTISFGSIPKLFVDDLGKTVKLKVLGYGMTDKTTALLVEGYYSNNENPHITAYVNVDGGGKPKDSNLIKSWTILDSPFHVVGKITQITTQNVSRL